MSESDLKCAPTTAQQELLAPSPAAPLRTSYRSPRYAERTKLNGEEPLLGVISLKHGANWKPTAGTFLPYSNGDTEHGSTLLTRQIHPVNHKFYVPSTQPIMSKLKSVMR